MSFSSLPRSLLLLSLGVVLGASTTYLFTNHASRSPSRPVSNDDEITLEEDIVDGVEGLIGHTKLVRIRSLSIATGCEILAKAEVSPFSDYPAN
jgi:cysteine synthase